MMFSSLVCGWGLGVVFCIYFAPDIVENGSLTTTDIVAESQPHTKI